MSERSVQLVRLGFATLLVLTAFVLRWPALDRQIWNIDEGSTVTMAQQVLDGQVLFRDAADNRTPLVPYLQALVLAVGGDWNMRAIHVALAAMLGLTAVFLWQLGRRLGHEAVGVFAALAFLCLETALIPDGMAAHTGWYLIFFSAAGFWLFAEALTRPRAWLALASGFSFGLAVLAKQPGLLDFGVTGVVALILSWDRASGRPWRLLPAMAAGLAIPIVATILYFLAHGALGDLVFYAWTYNTKYYVPEVPFTTRLLAFHIPLQLFLDGMPTAFWLAVPAAAGLLWLALVRSWRNPSRAILAWITLGWSASGLVSTILSGRDFAHYSIQLIPGASLACGWTLAWLWNLRPAGTAWLRWIARLAAAACLLHLTVHTCRWVRTLDLHEDSSLQQLGQLAKSRTGPGERIFIWGYMPELHVAAQRLPSTRFFYTNWLTGLIPWTNYDWFKDTRYAVIPGTQQQLQDDWNRHPPAMVVDSGGLRGYFKHPLKQQEWLWRKVRYEFVELEPKLTGSWGGYRLFRRIDDAPYGAPFPRDVSVDSALTVDAPAESNSLDVPVTVRYPAGTEAVELYKDGELYRRVKLVAPDAGTLVFTVVHEDLPLGERRLQVLARGKKNVASRVAGVTVAPYRFVPPPGPLLEFDGRTYAPLEATNLFGPMPQIPGNGLWDAHSPAKVVFERLPGLYGIEFEYKLSDLLGEEPNRWKTDGVDVVVRFENTRGEVTEHYRRHLDARFNPADRGLQRGTALLPTNEPGRVTLWVSPGRESDVATDWAYIKSIRSLPSPVQLRFRGLQLSPVHLDAPLGLAQIPHAGLEVSMLHAPSELEFELRPDMHRLKATYGLLPSAWEDPKGSEGATFEVWHVPPAGEPKRLYRDQLDPKRVPADRGHHTLEVELPKPTEGRIRLLIYATHPQNNAFNHTYWAALVAEGFPAVITTPTVPVPYETVTAQHGYNELPEGDRQVIFVHAPSELVFPLPAKLRQLSGHFGLIAGAYSGTEPTDGGRFVIEGERPDGQRVELWHRDLDPQNRSEDRGFLSFTVTLPPEGFRRLVFRTSPRPGHGVIRSWTFWHELRLAP